MHAPRAPLTLKPLQRGKNGDVIAPSDRSAMGPPLLNITMRPGRVLYIPRGFFHHTATDPAMLAADDVIAGRRVPQARDGDGDGGDGGGGGGDGDGGAWMDDGDGGAFVADGGGAAGGGAGDDGESATADFGQPSMALTLSILSEDVWATWLLLLGEALQVLPSAHRVTSSTILSAADYHPECRREPS